MATAPGRDRSGHGLDRRARDADDLIWMKTAAGRPKDLIEIPILQALREETGPDVEG